MRGVSDLPGRPWGRWQGQKGGSLTPHPPSSAPLGGYRRGKERRSIVIQKAGGKLLTAWD